MAVESYVEREMRTCRHFNGIQNDVCRASIRYEDVRDDTRKALDRFPCLGGGAFCEKRETPTREEVEAAEAEWKRLFASVDTARKAIKKATKNTRGVVGSMPCPICQTGTLQYSIASLNGHIHGKCSTDNCVSWME